MFSQMDVYLNNKLVSFNTNNYPWKAYLKTILFSGKDELYSQKQSELFYKDEATTQMHITEAMQDWSCDMLTHSKVKSLNWKET